MPTSESDLSLKLVITMYHWILILTLPGLIQGQAIISRPKGVTEKTGGSAEFECKVDFTGSIHTMQWLFDDQIIYAYEKGKEDFPMGSKKYAIAQDGRTFNLTVKELDLTDGGKYTCIVVTDSASALLIVLDTPQLLTPNPDKEEGTTAQFTCKAKFSGPSEEDDFPELQMSIGGDPVGGTIHLKEPVPLSDFYQYTQVHNITLVPNMKGNKLMCAIGTSNPAMHVSVTAEVGVLYRVRDISYNPKSAKYKVGTLLSCTADGSPEPQFVWEDMRHDAISINGSSLKITEEMLGSNTWRCTAKNLITGQMHKENVVAVFETVNSYDSGIASWQIALAVIFPITFVIILLVFGYRLLKGKWPSPCASCCKTHNKKEYQEVGTKSYKYEVGAERWLHGDLSEEEMRCLLKEDGDFLITYLMNQGHYKLSFKWDKTIKQALIKYDKNKNRWILEDENEFEKLNDIVFSLPQNEWTVAKQKVKFKRVIWREH